MEEEKADEALKASEKKLRDVTSVLGEGIYVLDSECRLTFMNPEAERLLGWTEAELLGRNVHEVIHYQTANGAPLPADECPMIGVLRSGVVYRTDDDVLTRKDGSIFPVAYIVTPIIEDGKVVSAVSAFRDITDRKRMEKKLRLFSEAVKGAPDGIQIVDLDGYVIYSNRAVEEIYGFCPDELRGRHVNELNVDPDFADRKIIPSIKETGRWIGELVVKHKTGRTFPIWLTCSMVKDDKGRPIAMVGIIRDITERKIAKELSDALNKVNAAIGSTFDFNEIMKRVVIESTKAIGAETGCVNLCENDYWALRYIYGLPDEMVGTRFSSKEVRHALIAARTRKPVVVNDTHRDERVDRKTMERFGIRSLLTVPLIVRDKMIGALCFHYHSGAVPFNDAQVDFASKLAISISLALENSRLYAIERNIADTLQDVLLTVPEQIQGVSFGHLYRPATEVAEVGGDFYDLFELEHDRVGIVIGDVSGKGLEAATLTSLVKNTIKAYAYEVDHPASIIAKTSDVVRRASAPTMFVTAFFGILNIRSGRLAYCCAGHPPAILRRKTFEVSLLSKSSPIIGAFERLRYVKGSETLEEGDMLILYTDGVTEARKDSEFFGEEGLLSCVKELKPPSAREMPELIFGEVMDFSHGKLSDDVALLSLSLSAASSK
ncbi:MAG: SpoIIE family protein phosphatase [Actinobacteria bacterium]|nr:SpoIIE family protein phosphatase [Actinomycetota bacterium]